MPLGDLRAKFEAFGWIVMEIENGHDIEQVLEVMSKAKKDTGKGKPV